MDTSRSSDSLFRNRQEILALDEPEIPPVPIRDEYASHEGKARRDFEHAPVLFGGVA